MSRYFYVHCSDHALDSVLQEASRNVILISDALNFFQGVSFTIIKLFKQETLFRLLFGIDLVTNLLGMCPTSKCVCVSFTSVQLPVMKF